MALHSVHQYTSFLSNLGLRIIAQCNTLALFQKELLMWCSLGQLPEATVGIQILLLLSLAIFSLLVGLISWIIKFVSMKESDF